MSLLDRYECPCCGGYMVGANSTLSSACRCGYPDVVTWNGFRTVDREVFPPVSAGPEGIGGSPRPVLHIKGD